ncbi:MAG: hypothetical protein AAGK01_13805 [Pseudomonadota bacterium]
MIRRRITQHIKDQNWTAIGIDFVIVVAGVFLGIQLGNWNQQASLDREKARYLQQLSTDFQVAEDTLEDQIADYRQYLAATRKALDIKRSKARVTEEEALDAFLTFGSGRIPPGSPPTLQELISSGKVDLIDDFELRNELMQTHAKFETMARIFDLVRIRANRVQTPIYAHIEYNSDVEISPKQLGDPTRSRKANSIDIAGLRADPEVETALEIFLNSHRNMLELELSALEQVSQLNEMLAAEIEEGS